MLFLAFLVRPRSVVLAARGIAVVKQLAAAALLFAQNPRLFSAHLSPFTPTLFRCLSSQFYPASNASNPISNTSLCRPIFADMSAEPVAFLDFIGFDRSLL